MKPTYLTALMLIVSVSVMAQKKPKQQLVPDTSKAWAASGTVNPWPVGTVETIKYNLINDSKSLIPGNYVFTVGSTKPVLVVDLQKDGHSNFDNPDMLILHLDKKKFRWLNDSTAVVVK